MQPPGDLDPAFPFDGIEIRVRLVDELRESLLGRLSAREACYKGIMTESGGEAAQPPGLRDGWNRKGSRKTVKQCCELGNGYRRGL
jgi:hypothetical protein